MELLEISEFNSTPMESNNTVILDFSAEQLPEKIAIDVSPGKGFGLYSLGSLKAGETVFCNSITRLYFADTVFRTHT